MSNLTKSPLPILKTLSSSLTSLDAILHPLLTTHTLEDITNTLQFGSDDASPPTGTAAKAEGKDGDEADELKGRLDSARLQVSLAYVVCDLVWIYLKAKGHTPTSHPVMTELERVKAYFGKIKAVQSQDKEEAHARLDKSAAGRFIRAALAGNAAEAGGAATASPVGKHTKFENEEGEGEGEMVNENASTNAGEGRGKRRERVDPFQGYDSPKTPAKRKVEEGGEAERVRTSEDEVREQVATGTLADGDASPSGSAQKKRKRRGKK